LKPALKEVQISQFQGQTAVIDIMVWLYKGAYSCAYELSTGKPTLNFLSYPIKMLRILITKGIKPICVFDGFHLKAKQETEKGRSEFKEKNHKIGMEFEEKGDIEEAKKYF
jgi:exonuclease-1